MDKQRKKQLDESLSLYQELNNLKNDLQKKKSTNVQRKETIDKQLEDINRKLFEFENVNDTLKKYRYSKSHKY